MAKTGRLALPREVRVAFWDGVRAGVGVEEAAVAAWAGRDAGEDIPAGVVDQRDAGLEQHPGPRVGYRPVTDFAAFTRAATRAGRRLGLTPPVRKQKDGTLIVIHPGIPLRPNHVS